MRISVKRFISCVGVWGATPLPLLQLKYLFFIIARKNQCSQKLMVLEFVIIANLLSENAIGERWNDATGWSFFAKDSVNVMMLTCLDFLKPHL